MEICRLCLDLLNSNDFLKLDVRCKQMLKNLVPELDIEVSSDPILCKQCSSSVDQLHTFKQQCQEKQQQLVERCKDKSKLTVKQILQGTKNTNDLVTAKVKDRACRTCLEPIECESFTVLTPSSPDACLDSMLKMCLPELDLQICLDPVMCEKCFSNLQKLHHLKTVCLEVEDKIKKYILNHGTKSPINLRSVLEMFQDNEINNLEAMPNIKTEIKAEETDSTFELAIVKNEMDQDDSMTNDIERFNLGMTDEDINNKMEE